jgi:hypothetical protein
MKPLGFVLEDLLDWDEYLNVNLTNVNVSVFQFLHSRLLYTFTYYYSRKSPAPQLQNNAMQNSAGVQASIMCVHTYELEVMRRIYDKKRQTRGGNVQPQEEEREFQEGQGRIVF